MLSATAMEETGWTTQFDLPSEDDVAFLFSELISCRAMENASATAESESLEKDEERQKSLFYLTDQWRRQEVTHRIARIKTCTNFDTGEKIAARVAALREMLKEEEGEEADISTESLRALQLFLQSAGRIQPPEITLTPEAEIYLRWKAGRDRLLAVHLVNGRMVRYAIFAPNPRHPRFVRRLSGIEASDTVLETAKNVFPDLEWVQE
ncbi:MAG: hypothetical protein SWC40_03890 [Thermodesulfobacteriota bacterium]|nr:hypothetical protein [Thermodesulfobacteriota bacterium]